MKKLLMATAVFALMSTAAFATTPGVNDFVTDIRIGNGNPNCIRFQTANNGGNTTGTGTTTAAHTWNGSAGSYGIGTGSGSSSVGQANAAGLLQALITSLWVGSSAGPYIQFTDQGAFASGQDCPTTDHITSPLDQ